MGTGTIPLVHMLTPEKRANRRPSIMDLSGLDHDTHIR